MRYSDFFNYLAKYVKIADPTESSSTDRFFLLVLPQANMVVETVYIFPASGEEKIKI